MSKHSNRVATQHLTEITLHCSECSERTHTPHRKQAVFVSPRHCRQKPAPHEALRFAKKRFATCPVSNSLPNGSQSYTSAAGMSGSHPVERERVFNVCMYAFNVLGGNWDPTDKKFSSVNSYRQDLLLTCKAFPKETTTCIWFTQSHKVCNGTTVLQEVQML